VSSPSLAQDYMGMGADDRYYGCVQCHRGDVKRLIGRMYLAVALFFITNLFSLYRLSKNNSLPDPQTVLYSKDLINRLVAKAIRR